MRLLRFLFFFRRRRRAESAPIGEEDAYTRSYGDRTGEVVSVTRMPEPAQAEPEPKPEPGPESEPKPEPESEAQRESESAPESEAEPEPKPNGSKTGQLTGELLRCAFEAKLDARGKTAT